MDSTLPFVHGDGNTHNFFVPAANWGPGGKLFFAAKLAFDDVSNDSSAYIKGAWDDTVVSNVTINGVAYKKYVCYFGPEATNSVQSQGAPSIDLLGEFQYVPASGVPITFPGADDDKIPTILYFDINRRVS